MLTRRTFIASLLGAIAAPRLALPAPPAGMVETVAPMVIAFRESWDYSVVAVRTRVVLFGEGAKTALEFNPHLWSAVMVDWSIDRPGTFSGKTPQQVATKLRVASRA